MSGKRARSEAARLDEAARAGWLYYVAGCTQDEVAKRMNVSRQSAQRLVTMAMSERLIKVRLDHPIARCMELAEILTEAWGLRHCEIVPTDPAAPSHPGGVALAAAGVLENLMQDDEPRIVALGTGRALKATMEQLAPMQCPHHRVVSMLGNIMADGRATAYNATISMAEHVGAMHYPSPLPVLAQDEAELQALLALHSVQNIRKLCAEADLTMVGIGQMGETAPLVVDGFMSDADLAEVLAAGAAGEITSWVYDGDGQLIDCNFNRRVASVPLTPAGERLVIAVGVGLAKVPSLLAALRGGLVNGVIIDEAMAEKILPAVR